MKYLDTALPGLLKRLATGPLVVSYKIGTAPDHTESFSLQFGQAKGRVLPSATSSNPTPTPQPFCWNVVNNASC